MSLKAIKIFGLFVLMVLTLLACEKESRVPEPIGEGRATFIQHSSRDTNRIAGEADYQIIDSLTFPYQIQFSESGLLYYAKISMDLESVEVGNYVVGGSANVSYSSSLVDAKTEFQANSGVVEITNLARDGRVSGTFRVDYTRSLLFLTDTVYSLEGSFTGARLQ